MQSKQSTPPDKTYYKLVNNVWQRCFASEAEIVVCTTAPMRPTFNEFRYAIDLRSQTKIADISEIAPEIHIDLCFGEPLPAMRIGGNEETTWSK